MADIELVIKISQESYNNLKIGCTQRVSDNEMIEAIKNGTPLLKGHGKLVDVSSIPKEDRHITVKSLLRPGTIAFVGAISLEEYINGLSTIIEADKEQE